MFREEYRELSEGEKAHVAAIKSAASDFFTVLSNVIDSREKSLAITKLEECVMWATKSITK